MLLSLAEQGKNDKVDHILQQSCGHPSVLLAVDLERSAAQINYMQ